MTCFSSLNNLLITAAFKNYFVIICHAEQSYSFQSIDISLS